MEAKPIRIIISPVNRANTTCSGSFSKEIKQVKKPPNNILSNMLAKKLIVKKINCSTPLCKLSPLDPHTIFHKISQENSFQTKIYRRFVNSAGHIKKIFIKRKFNYHSFHIPSKKPHFNFCEKDDGRILAKTFSNAFVIQAAMNNLKNLKENRCSCFSPKNEKVSLLAMQKENLHRPATMQGIKLKIL